MTADDCRGDLADRERTIDLALEAAEEALLAALGDAQMLTEPNEETDPSVLVLRRHIAAIRTARDEVSEVLVEGDLSGRPDEEN
jgi:hypothetical protein